jgi:hypothetical protein
LKREEVEQASGSKSKYCGKGDKGRKIAEAAKAKAATKNYELREVLPGLKTKRVELKIASAY